MFSLLSFSRTVKALSAGLIILSSFPLFATDEQGPPVHFLTGSYTAGKSDGINLLTYTPHLQTFENKGTVATTKNPSYFTLTKDHNRLYAVDESSDGAINQFYWHSGSEQFKWRQRYPNVGGSPCYIALNPTETQLAVANYGSGDVAVFEMTNAKGRLNKIAQYQGRPRDDKQKSHMHWYNWDPKGRFAYSVDLGTDGINLHLDDGFQFESMRALNLLTGDGPRHMAIHPTKDIVYVINELSNTLVAATINPETGILKAFQRINILPKNVEGKNYAAAIKFSKDGRYLYASLRGVNLMSVFKLDKDGNATVIQHISTFGDWPRDFTLSDDNKYLVVVNQKSNNVVLFKRDADSGVLNKTGIEVKVDSPTFVTAFKKP